MTIDPLILVRGIHFAATLLAAGTTVFIWLVAEPAASKPVFATLHRRLTEWVWLALAAAVISGALWLVLLASNILGDSIADVCLHGGAWAVLADTRFGLVWCVRLLLALLLTGLLPWPATRWFQITVAAAFLALPALAGHAGATPGVAGNLHLVSDMLHLLAAGAWLGGLPAFAFLLWRLRRSAGRRRDGRGRIVTRAVGRFSRLVVLSVGILLASGLVNSWSLLTGPRDLIASDYGRLVALKITLFGAMVAIAAVNKFYLTPRLPKPAALRALRRNSLGEICLGLFVLTFVAVLGTLPPSKHVHAASTGIPPDAAFVHIHTSEVMADVTIEPGRAGRTDVTIRVTREDSSSYPAKDVRLALDPPSAGTRTIDRAAVRQPDGSWLVNDLTLAPAGIWATRVIVRPGTGEPIVLDAPIVIER